MSVSGRTIVDEAAHPSRELGLGEILEIATGFQKAQVLLAANELGVFGLLSSGSQTADEIARILKIESRAITALLDACVGLRLLQKSDRGYHNSRAASLFLGSDREPSVRPVLRFWSRFGYGPWGRLLDAIRSDQPQTDHSARSRDLFEHLFQDDGASRVFFEGLAGMAYWPALRMAELLDFSTRRHLLDVGGGSGIFSDVIAKRHRHLRVTLFDLAPVGQIACERFRKSDAADRLTTVVGDFHKDTLPRDVDCALVSNVLHDWSSEECLALLRKIHAALDPGGQVIVYDFMPTEGEVSLATALFTLTLALDTLRGRVYEAEELHGWLTACGFQRIQRQPITSDTSVMTAVKT